MSNQVVESKTNSLTTTPTNQAWGAETASTKDVLIPKLALMQSMSGFVLEEKAAPGDMVNTVTGEVLGAKTKAVEIIPISMFKTWVELEDGKFARIYPVDAKNENQPNEERLPGSGGKDITVKRYYTLNFYVLNANDLTGLPYVVSFKSTSLRTGKKVNTYFTTCQMRKVPPASETLKLTSLKRSNDKGTWYVYEVEKGRATTQEELGCAYSWYQTLKNTTHRVDDSDFKEDTTTDSDVDENSSY